MHDMLGIGLLALGLGVLAGAARKRRVRARVVLAAGQIRPEFAVIGEIARPLLLFVVAVFAAKLSLFYFVLGGAGLLSGLDFAALLFVLAAYGVYVVAATMPPRVAAHAVPGETAVEDGAEIGAGPAGEQVAAEAAGHALV